MTVLQLIKEKQLTVAQEAESRLIFELATDGAEKMSVHQLKMCLQALNFHVLKKEAQALVYEFDYLSTNTIELADFQKIFLAKTLESSERDRFDQAFRALAGEHADEASLHQLSSASRALELLKHENGHSIGKSCDDVELIDDNVIRHQMALLLFVDEDDEAVQTFLNTTEPRISKKALAAFLGVH